MRRALPYLLLTGLSLPFLGKPVHVDDANFLALARRAASHPWTPHGGQINWQGHTERALDVLSNPPGIAWWLAPVAHAEAWVQHLWMLPWLWLSTWGALQLGKTITGRPTATAVLILGSPVALLATQALTPDLPLLACVLAGTAGLLGPARARWPWALLLGCAALFRYSGVALIPIAMLWPWLHGDRRAAVRLGGLVALPLGLLLVHDWSAYGQLHLVSMVGFQAVSGEGLQLLHKAASSLGMLGGAVVLPLLCWRHPTRALSGAMIGAGLGCSAVALLEISGAGAIAAMGFTTAGGAVLGGIAHTKDKTETWLLLWLGIGIGFLLVLRFSAARYWIPFMPPVVLLSLRAAPPRWIGPSAVLTVLLGLSLAVDDLELARAQAQTAAAATAQGTGLIAGHWGFQHHLEQAGWRAIEDDAPLPPGALLARSAIAWPQATTGCQQATGELIVPDRWPGPRVHTASGGANIHGHTLYGTPPQPVLAPWSLGSDAQDVMTIYRGCTD